jgi:peptidoglycan/LPS O-acetylase OafA/YrhL
MKLNYRPEIDGLRAIAVCSVIIYHAKITVFNHEIFLKGGYLGVDIFFVISGYLISLILFNNIGKKNFSLLKFYQRRVRRIIPALLLVITLSFPLALYIILIPNELVDYAKAIISSILLFSNFNFFFHGQEYGANNSLLIPFLHTWSLSVEEQFYIIFPVLIIFIFKYQKVYLPHVLVFIFFVSLFVSEFGSKSFSSFNFYMLISRMWELTFGSLIAYYEYVKNSKKNIYNPLFRIMPAIGIFLIFISIYNFDGDTRHPSIITLFPVFGAGLIIFFANKDDFVTKILSSKFFVSIGIISYSLYLWHYPIFAFARITGLVSDSLINKIFLGLFIILLSVASYYFVELPARNKEIKFKKIIKIIFMTISINIFVSLFIIYKEGFIEKYNNIYLKNNIFNNELREQSWKYVDMSDNQKFKEKNKIKILLVGDSFSKDLFNLFYLNKDLFNEYEFVRYGNKSNKDAFLFDKNYSMAQNIKFEENELFRNSDYILISNYFLNIKEIQNLKNFIQYFKDKKKIVISSNSNIYQNGLKYKRFYGLTLFDYYLFKNNETLNLVDKNLTQDVILKINQYYFKNKVNDKINLHLKNISKKQNLIFLNKNDFMCDNLKKVCFGSTDLGFKTSYDGKHFTLKGAKFFGRKAFYSNWFQIK